MGLLCRSSWRFGRLEDFGFAGICVFLHLGNLAALAVFFVAFFFYTVLLVTAW